MTNKEQFVFLIGGHDREMSKIIDILQGNGCTYYDAGLDWSNASLSQYQSVIDELEKLPSSVEVPTIVPIELKIDVQTWLPMHIIDHHNELAHLPASILQVCNLLEIDPTDEIKIIGAADAGGWRALIRNGFTLEQAKNFMKPVLSDEDYHEIQKAWKEREIIRNLTIVRMNHSKTVATCSLYAGEYDRILFISPSELNFYEHPDTVRELKYVLGGWTGGEGLFVPEYKSCYWGLSNPSEHDINRAIQICKNYSF